MYHSCIRCWTINNHLCLNGKSNICYSYTTFNDLNNSQVSNNIYYENAIQFLDVSVYSHLSFFLPFYLCICCKLSKTAETFYSFCRNAAEYILLSLLCSLVDQFLSYVKLLCGGADKVHLIPLKMIDNEIIWMSRLYRMVKMNILLIDT